MNIGNKHNSDDVFSRAVITGVINLLNNKIQYENYLSDNTIDVIEVPWFFNQSGDERFMQDFFEEWDSCIHPKISSGNFDIIPRGVTTLTSETIDTNSLTNNFVRGNHVKEINGELHIMNSFIKSIPVTMGFECEIKVDSMLDGFKIKQVLTETFYSTQVFSVSYKGTKVPCQVGFPESIGTEKTYEYSYDDDTTIKLSFELELHTFQPVFDKTSERHGSNRMQNFLSNVNAKENKHLRSLTLKSPSDSELYYSYEDMRILWTSEGTMLKVNLMYQVNNSGDWIIIDNGIINSGIYILEVPLMQKKYPTVVVSQNTGYPALFKVFVNGLGEIEEIKILNSGDNYTNDLMLDVEEIGRSSDITYVYDPYNTDDPDNLDQKVYGNNAEIQPIIENGKIVNVKIIDGGSGYTPTEEFDIKIRIEDANDPDIYDEVNNIKVR